MIISSEHHDLIEDYQAAVAAEGEALKITSEYIKTPNFDRATFTKLCGLAEEAHNKSMDLRDKLKIVKRNESMVSELHI